MLQPELLSVFSGHKKIPETAGMCKKIELMNVLVYFHICVNLGKVLLNKWVDISLLTNMLFHRFQMPPLITIMLQLDFNSPH